MMTVVMVEGSPYTHRTDPAGLNNTIQAQIALITGISNCMGKQL